MHYKALKMLEVIKYPNTICPVGFALTTQPLGLEQNMFNNLLQLILGLCSSSRCSQMLLNKGGQVLQVSLAAVLLRLLPILVNVECGEAVDAVGAAVHVADCHLGIVFVFLSKFLPGRCQPLTMATPGSEELDEGNPSFDFGVKVVLAKFGDW